MRWRRKHHAYACRQFRPRYKRLVGRRCRLSRRSLLPAMQRLWITSAQFFFANRLENASRPDRRENPRGKLLATSNSPGILLANHAAPCRKALSGMLLHPLGELRCAHQAGLHRDVGEVRGGDDLLAAICRRRETAENGDDLDHDRRAPSLRWALAPLSRTTYRGLVLLLADWISRRKDAVVYRAGFSN